jgi:hypothetical protein
VRSRYSDLEREILGTGMHAFDNDVRVSPRARQQYKSLINDNSRDDIDDILGKTFGNQVDAGMGIGRLTEGEMMLPQAYSESITQDDSKEKAQMKAIARQIYIHKKKEYRGLLKNYYDNPNVKHDWFDENTGRGLKHQRLDDF